MSPSHITPHTISIPTPRLNNLKTKLALTDFPDELENAEWDYGAPLPDIKRLTTYWKDEYDWRSQEAKMNELPQFRMEVQVEGFGDVGVHFVWKKGKVDGDGRGDGDGDERGAVPLLFVHGWPGSFLEVEKILEMLTDPDVENAPVFDVVAPSLPNFGFSDGIKQRGFGLKQYAECCHRLMGVLGYGAYVTQGGDWGSHITRVMGAMYPESVKASHINYIRPLSAPPLTSSPLLALQHATTPYTEDEKSGLERSQWFKKEGSGYNHIQSTKPQTLGYALTDSPVGLLAWIYEKLHDWTDDYPWTDDEILTWVCMYYFSTAGPAASLRIYYENTKAEDVKIFGSYIPRVKLGLSYFPKDLSLYPRSWGRALGNVVFEKVHGEGGHFAAYERPGLLVGDLRGMFGRGGGAEGVVPGRSGLK